jgi:hypothetical protein
MLRNAPQYHGIRHALGLARAIELRGAADHGVDSVCVHLIEQHCRKLRSHARFAADRLETHVFGLNFCGARIHVGVVEEDELGAMLFACCNRIRHYGWELLLPHG